MPIEIVRYGCEYCGKEYDSKYGVENHESSHLIPHRIVRADYGQDSEHPEYLVVEFTRGPLTGTQGVYKWFAQCAI